MAAEHGRGYRGERKIRSGSEFDAGNEGRDHYRQPTASSQQGGLASFAESLAVKQSADADPEQGHVENIGAKG